MNISTKLLSLFRAKAFGNLVADITMPNAKTVHYSAVFEPSEQGGYAVSFPDFPGCVTYGDTFEEAKKHAQEVLEVWLEELTAQGETISVHECRPIIDDVAAAVPAGAQLSYASTHS